MFLSGTYGVQRLIDSNQRVMNSNKPTYYVTQNFDSSQGVQFGMGLMYVPSVTGGNNTGTKDDLISPPPTSSSAAPRNSPEAASVGIELRTGTRVFQISHTWVVSVQTAKGYATAGQVFSDKSVVGLRYDGVLFNIVSANDSEAYGVSSMWEVVGNSIQETEYGESNS